MKKCKNCITVVEDNINKCPQCSMNNSFEPVSESAVGRKDTAIKKIYKSCSNCGTTDLGEEDNCQVCRFPISYKNQNQQSPNSKTQAS